jgi:8-oxo-dGTP diphosphatase
MYSYSYPRPAVTVDAILFSKQNSVLLIERGRDPYKGKWALPGGFVDMDEELENACLRELREETGIQVKKLTQIRTYGTVGRDPRGRTISVVYYAVVEKELEASAGDDAAKAHWFPINQLPDMAFDHRQIILEFFSYFMEKI